MELIYCIKSDVKKKMYWWIRRTTQDAKFTIIERIEKDINIKFIIKKKKKKKKMDKKSENICAIWIW